MKLKTFSFIMATAMLGIIAINKIIPEKTTGYYCVDATILRAHNNGVNWAAEYIDESGEIWAEYVTERPEIRPYTLLINDNGTPYDSTDDIVEEII